MKDVFNKAGVRKSKIDSQVILIINSINAGIPELGSNLAVEGKELRSWEMPTSGYSMLVKSDWNHNFSTKEKILQ